MMDMIRERRQSEKKEERYDLFSSLLDASEEELGGSAKLTDRELMGRCPWHPQTHRANSLQATSLSSC